MIPLTANYDDFTTRDGRYSISREAHGTWVIHRRDEAGNWKLASTTEYTSFVKAADALGKLIQVENNK